MSTSGISIGTPNAATTLSVLKDSFAASRQDQHLRFSDGKGLHTHGSLEFTKVDFLAKFRNAGALQERADLRQNAIAQVKTAIDNEFGAGMGDRVFARADRDGIGQGALKVSDLDRLSAAAHEIQQSDITTANARLGGNLIIGGVMSATVNACGYDLSSLSQEELAGVKHRMAGAVLALPQGATSAQCERAAQGALVADQFERSVANIECGGGKTGLTDTQKTALGELIEVAFGPLRTLGDRPTAEQRADRHLAQHLVNTPVGALSDKLLSMNSKVVGTLSGDKRMTEVPSAKGLNGELGKDRAEGATKRDNATEIATLMRFETASASGTREPEKTFMRHNNFPLAFQIFNMKLNPQFETRLTATAQAVMTRADGSTLGEATEHRAVQMPGDANSAPQQTRATEAFQAYDRGLTTLYGGSDATAMRAAAGQVPQDACDYLAAAHQAVRNEAQSANLDPGVTAQLIKSININFLSLRSVGPLLAAHKAAQPDQDGVRPKPTDAEARQDASMVNLSKFFQNCANGINSTTNPKEAVPTGAYVASTANPISQKWMQNLDAFVTEVAARGNSPV